MLRTGCYDVSSGCSAHCTFRRGVASFPAHPLFRPGGMYLVYADTNGGMGQGLKTKWQNDKMREIHYKANAEHQITACRWGLYGKWDFVNTNQHMSTKV